MARTGRSQGVPHRRGAQSQPILDLSCLARLEGPRKRVPVLGGGRACLKADGKIYSGEGGRRNPSGQKRGRPMLEPSKDVDVRPRRPRRRPICYLNLGIGAIMKCVQPKWGKLWGPVPPCHLFIHPSIHFHAAWPPGCNACPLIKRRGTIAGRVYVVQEAWGGMQLLVVDGHG